MSWIGRTLTLVVLCSTAAHGQGIDAGKQVFQQPPQVMESRPPNAGNPSSDDVPHNIWQFAPRLDADQWQPAVELGALGSGPWGNVFHRTNSLPAADTVFHTLPGFQVERLFTVPKDSLGSWVCLAMDPQGRLYASDQGNGGLCRITPPPIGSQQPTKVEKLDLPMTSAQGMLFAFDSLYLSVNGGPGSGLYRAADRDGDGQFDDVQLLRSLQGGGEHGPHALRLSPDGRSIYIIAGNHTSLPEISSSRIPTNWGEDLLLPRQWDARGHARGRLAPGGWICQVDPDGKQWQVFSIGYRNPYDMDFNADGELFAYDADMEWDMGTPWYRPTRVMHATSGSEFGWRSGTGKWPEYYLDSLPAAVDVGPGSPVGVTFGYGTRFPARYQRALYILDWTFGTIYAVHLRPDGASYAATKEEFLSRSPLPLTDAVVGPDGALYFAIGGRGTQSELYRVTYVGDEATEPADLHDTKFAELRSMRHQMERLHSDPDPSALPLIWSRLGHPDRHIRYAARVSLEQLPVAQWQSRVLSERDPPALITAAAALARQGENAQLSNVLSVLERIEFASLDPAAQLDLLRTYQLLFIRMGHPGAVAAARLSRQLDPYFPAETDALNRELSTLLVYLDSPIVIGKTLELMQQPSDVSDEDISELIARNPGYGRTIAGMLANRPEIQKIHYAFALRTMRYGWTLEQRRQYFDWLAAASRRSGGASYEGFIDNIRKEAIENLSDAERAALDATAIAPPPKADQLPKPHGPGRKWTTSELVELADGNLNGRDFQNGRRAYAAAKCVVCHRFDGNGGATGPDLTNVAGRFGLRDLSEALLEPSKVVSDQYRASVVTTRDGLRITGRIVADTGKQVTIMTDPEDATKITELAPDEIEAIDPSPISLMPNGLLDELNRDEVLDLLAYLYSRGNPQDVRFVK